MTGFDDVSRQSPTPGERREKKGKKRARELVDPSSQLPTPSELRKKKHKKRVTNVDDAQSRGKLTKKRGRKKVEEGKDAGYHAL
jgi:hypothetical protein